MALTKKRVIKSLENLSEDLRELIQHQYPTGYQSSIQRISNAKNEPIFVFPLETEDAVYLVKVPTTKNSDGDYSVQSNKKQDFDGEDDFKTPDDDAEAGDNSDDFDDDGDGGKKDPSYDPDFDD
jgi:hypothetical protein